MDEFERQPREHEAEVLAQIGRYLFGQDLRIAVRLPTALAAGASAAWNRDDSCEIECETPSSRTIRLQAGALALMGLAIQEQDVLTDGDEVEVVLDAWQIGTALDAAEERGLLNGLTDDRP